MAGYIVLGVIGGLLLQYLVIRVAVSDALRTALKPHLVTESPWQITPKGYRRDDTDDPAET